MKIDLSHLGRIAQHLPEEGDLTLITLKGHLLVEEMLDTIVASKCKDKSILVGVEIGFYVKLKLAAALVGSEASPLVWSMAEKLNALRNALAHKLEHPLAQKRLETFLGLIRSPNDDLSSSGDSEKDLRHAIIFLLGGLMAIASGTISDNSSLQIDA